MAQFFMRYVSFRNWEFREEIADFLVSLNMNPYLYIVEKYHFRDKNIISFLFLFLFCFVFLFKVPDICNLIIY